MKRACSRCERTSVPNSLFCPELDCPAELAPGLFEAGERLGDIEVVRTIVTTRCATLYEALQQGERVFLKVAAPGEFNTRRLQREARFLRTVRADRRRSPVFPRLRAPYTSTTIKTDPFGMIVVEGELLYFYLIDPVEGESLQDLLLKQPQWWVNHVGWVAMQLATAINQMHLKDVYHLGLGPSSVLARFDSTPDVPRVVLWDLGVISDRANLAGDWYPEYVLPAYLAPELVGGADATISASVASDVHSLGVVLYEMLVGQPAFPYRLATEAQIRDAVARGRRVEMDRVEDVAAVANIAVRAAATDPGDRFRTAAEVVEELAAVVGPVPTKKKRGRPSGDFILVVIVAVIVAVLLIMVAIAMSQ
ncbi:MAG TPA: protein kinase [Chloroflexota bacterium]|nr:protein kinase [Chloroflexota bacterium]